MKKINDVKKNSADSLKEVHSILYSIKDSFADKEDTDKLASIMTRLGKIIRETERKYNQN